MVTKFWANVVKKLNIPLGRSTFVFMVPDPLAVLEEDEIHFGFSSSFTDSRSGFSDTMLHNIDVLVARLPAIFNSDIRRVCHLQACW